MQNLLNICIEDIDDKLSEVVEIADNNGQLDHFVRAVEDYIYEQSNFEFKEKKKEIRAKLKKDPNYKLTSDENATLNSNRAFFKVFKNYGRNLQKGKGYTFFFNLGADLYYSGEGIALEKYIAVAHELGHILLHFGHNSKELDGNIVLETQAAYFSEIVMEHRNKQFKAKDYALSRIFESNSIVSSIKSIYPQYDKSLIKQRA